jgi:hypothetical protein
LCEGTSVRSRAMEKRKRDIEERRRLLDAKRRKTRGEEHTAEKPKAFEEAASSVTHTSIPDVLQQRSSAQEPKQSTQKSPSQSHQSTVDPFAALESRVNVPEGRPANNDADSFLEQLGIDLGFGKT